MRTGRDKPVTQLTTRCHSSSSCAHILTRRTLATPRADTALMLRWRCVQLRSKIRCRRHHCDILTLTLCHLYMYDTLHHHCSRFAGSAPTPGASSCMLVRRGSEHDHYSSWTSGLAACSLFAVRTQIPTPGKVPLSIDRLAVSRWRARSFI